MSEIYSPGSIAGPPVTFMGPYNTGTTYSIGQAVSSGGSSYVSLIAGNIGCDPAASPTQWALLSAKGDPYASFEASEVFLSASSITITHGLGTLTPIIQGRVLSGATRWSASSIDANNTVIQSTGPMSIALAFLGGTPALPAAPAITQQPGSDTVDVAGMLYFTANASGSPQPSAQWQTDNGTAGITWTNVSDATSPIYSVAGTGKDGWQYRAVFTNASGSATTAISKVTLANITNGLINYWPMNEGSGTTFVDAAGGKNLSAAGLTWAGTKPVFSGAERASGATGAAPSVLQNSTSPFTISMWASLPSSVMAGSNYLLTNSDGGYGGYMLGTFNNGNLGMLVFSGNTMRTAATAPLTGFTPNVRCNFIATYDGTSTAAGFKFYLNGVLLTPLTPNDLVAGGTMTGAMEPLTLMSEYDGNGGVQNSLAGSMDHVRIYSRILSSGDIALIQTGGN